MTDELATPNYDDVVEDAPVGESFGDNGGIIEIDVSDAKDPFDPAPHDNYRLAIREYKMTRSKSSGNPMIAAVLEIIGPESAAEHIGKNVFDNMVLFGNGEKFGRFRHKQISLAVGLPPTGGVPASSYIGKEFDAELAVQPGDATNPPKNVIRTIFVPEPDTAA